MALLAASSDNRSEIECSFPFRAIVQLDISIFAGEAVNSSK